MSDSRRSKMAPLKLEIDGHEYVDLGLSVKWAKMNVGASKETDYGNYYMYGKGSRTYNSSDNAYSGTENPLAASADTAVQVWGGNWRMPTEAEFSELTTNTTYQWISIDGVWGGKFTATNGNYIFLPAAGYWYIGTQHDVGIYGYYWSSTPCYSDYAYYLNFNREYEYVYDDYRGFGFSVRPVIG